MHIIPNVPAIPKGVKKPATRTSVSQPLTPAIETHTHETPVSEEEVLGLGVEGNVGARTLGVVVGASELGAGGREATAGDEGIGHSGPESDGGTHLGV